MIEKNVPLPYWFRNDTPRKYPWRKCADVGDSFMTLEPINKVLEAMKKFCQRNKEFKFHASEVEPGKVRVWRVK